MVLSVQFTVTGTRTGCALLMSVKLSSRLSSRLLPMWKVASACWLLPPTLVTCTWVS